MIDGQRLFLEGYMLGLRISELLMLAGANVKDCNITVPNIRTNGPNKVILLPQQLAKKLSEYIRDNGIKSTDRLFPYSPLQANKIIFKLYESKGFSSVHELRKYAFNKRHLHI